MGADQSIISYMILQDEEGTQEIFCMFTISSFEKAQNAFDAMGDFQILKTIFDLPTYSKNSLILPEY